MIVVLNIVVLCWLTLRRSYAIEVIPASYAWSTFTGPVSGEVQEVKPWSPSHPPASSFSEFESANADNNYYGPDYVAKPHYSFAYGVENPNTGDSHGHSETRDGSHVTGEYTVMEPDGVLRRVLYTADPKNGFRASVRYVRPDGEESPNRDHGYHGGGGGGPDHGPPQQQQSDYESGGGGGDDDGPRPFAPQPQSPSLPSEYESEVDDEPFAPQLPRPQPLSLNFGFNKYNDGGHINNDGDHINNDDDDNGDYGVGRPSAFKFPSQSSPFFKAPDTVNDSGDYGDGDKYYHWPDSLDPSPPPPPSSPSPFGLPSSPAPSFGGTGGSAAASPTTPFVGFAKRPSPTEPLPCRPQPSPSHAPLSSDVVSYQTGHSNRLPSFAKSSDGLEQFRSLKVNIGGGGGGGDGDEDDHDDFENYESDDSDTDNAHVSDFVRLSPSAKSAPSPLPSERSTSSTPRPPSPTASATARPPAVTAPPPSMMMRRPPSPIDALAIDLSPSPTMTPIQPTIIDIDV